MTSSPALFSAVAAAVPVGAINNSSLDLDSIRVGLHLLAMAVWIGGQIVMLALLPVLRAAGEAVPTRAADAFGRVAWPAFVVAVVTGIWNMFSVGMADASTGYNIAFGIKILLVVAAGVATFLHQRATTPARRGASAGVGFLASLVVVILGVMMAH